jgi:hypothetical protein
MKSTFVQRGNRAFPEITDGFVEPIKESDFGRVIVL